MVHGIGVIVFLLLTLDTGSNNEEEFELVILLAALWRRRTKEDKMEGMFQGIRSLQVLSNG